MVKLKFLSPDSNLLMLLKDAEEIAAIHYEGHFTIFRFTTEWKCAFGTPDLCCGGWADRDPVGQLPRFLTLGEALEYMIANRLSFDDEESFDTKDE